MNICIFNIRENNPYIGGVERVSYMLGHEWLKMGHHVIFISLYKSSINKKYTSCCKEFTLPNQTEAISTKNINYFTKLLQDNNIDIIINQCYVFPELCKLCKIIKLNTKTKLITAIHYAPLCQITTIENNFFIKEKLGYSLSKWLLNVGLFLKYYLFQKKQIIKKEKQELLDIVTHSDAVVCLSQSFLPAFKRLLGNYNNSKLTAIPNPIQMDSITINSSKKKQLIYVGRLEFGMKRVDRLINIWAKTERLFPDWSLHIVGDGDMRHMFESMAQKHELKRIYFEGFQKPDKYYAESSIICLTSSSEGFGMVLVEALKQKCIPIAYDSFTALSDIIENNINGYCIPPFKEKNYLKKLHYLMKNEDERIRLSDNHKVTLHNFELSTVSNLWLNLIKEIITQ